jgi:hypothetical protein
MTPDPDALALAPFVARRYYTGQWTALYALASSGNYVPGLAGEAERAARLAERLYMAATDPAEAEELSTDAEALHALAIDAARWEAEEEEEEAIAERIHEIDVYTR